jgi:UDP-N-acetylmuramyl pentapeptide phosphotransferase/UDP-N-acetylglucosamine-1-phosphate transferase
LPTDFAYPLIAGVAAISAALLCIVLRPLLLRYALARPNARSSHSVPTPQGGGIAVLAGAFLALGVSLLFWAMPGPDRNDLALVALAATLLAIVGAWDDIKPLPASIRLVLQAACVGLVVSFAAPEIRLFPAFPLALERGLALLAGIWFVNLTNFMDGIDWITVAGYVPLCAALALAGLTGLLDPATALLAAALCGGLIGFAPFNKPTARLFLGDVGSLPIGLVTAYLLYRLAGTGALAAALILPLYHVADSTITLLRRLARGEKVWEAHRSHFYQQATVNGYSVNEIVARIALLNLGLIALAAVSIHWSAFWMQVLSLLAAMALTGLLLRRFSRRRASHG